MFFFLHVQTFLFRKLMKRLLSFRTDSIFLFCSSLLFLNRVDILSFMMYLENADASYTVQSSFASLVSMDGTRTR